MRSCFIRISAVRRRAVRCAPLLLALVSLGIASCGDIPEADRVVATVNGKSITHGDLIRELQAKQGPVILLDMIDDVLIRQEAQTRKLALSQQERDAGLEQAAARVGSMSDLEARLQRSGIPMEAYRHDIETRMLLDKIALQEVKVSDSEVTAYYKKNLAEFMRGERVRARMMLFGDRASAEAVLETLKLPEADFAGLATSLSEDDATRARGGDMGYFQREDYAPAISDVAFSLKPGQTSGIIQAPDGFVILRVEGRKPAGPLSLQDVSTQIRQRLQSDKLQQARDAWLLKARKDAKLQIPNEELRKGVEARLGTPKPVPMPGQL